MRTVNPGPGFYELEWSKECTCSGVGHDGVGCGAQLLVEWDDLFLTSRQGGDPRKQIRNPQAPKSKADFLKTLEIALGKGPSSLNSQNTLFVSFCCHICHVETDLIAISTWEAGPQGFYLLLTRQERAAKLAPFNKSRT